MLPSPLQQLSSSAHVSGHTNLIAFVKILNTVQVNGFGAEGRVNIFLQASSWLLRDREWGTDFYHFYYRASAVSSLASCTAYSTVSFKCLQAIVWRKINIEDKVFIKEITNSSFNCPKSNFIRPITSFSIWWL